MFSAKLLAFASDHSYSAMSRLRLSSWHFDYGDWVIVHVSVSSNGNSSAKGPWVEAGIAENHAQV